jgi:hypothetical protein
MNTTEQQGEGKSTSPNRFFLLSIFCLGLSIFSISQIFKDELSLLYKRYVNGNEFEIGGSRYEVSDEFIIFKEEKASVYLIYYDSNRLSSIIISEFESNYFDHLVKSKNTELLEFGGNCKIYRVIEQGNSNVNLFWLDEKKKIFMEATIDESILKNELICDAVKQR